MATPETSSLEACLGPGWLADPAPKPSGASDPLAAQAFIVIFDAEPRQLDPGVGADRPIPRPVVHPGWPTRPGASVRLTLLELPYPDDALAAARRVLTAGQRDKADRIRQPGRRAGYMLAHALLRLNLVRLSGLALDTVELRYDGNGRPALDPPVPGLSFSISYGATACAVALAPQAIGIDVEAVRDDLDWPGIAARFFSPAERALIEAPAGRQTKIETFFEIWCRKEAALKCAGKGIDAAEFLDTEPRDPQLVPSGVLTPKDPSMPRVAWALALSGISGRPEPGTSGFRHRSSPDDWR